MKKFLFLLVIFGLVAFYGFRFLNDNGILSPLNNRLNDFVKNKPKIACAEDKDCHLTPADCNPCNCGGVAANVAWRPYCPFEKAKNVFCAPCEKPLTVENIKCINTECKIVY